MAFGNDGRLLVASVSSETIYAVDLRTRRASPLVGPPIGGGDDLVVAPDGAVYWTAILEGKIRKRSPDGAIMDIAADIPGANSLALSADGEHLYIGQVFFGDGLWDVDPKGRRPAQHLLSDIGGLNAFSLDRDGRIYGPIWEKGEVVRIDPRDRTMKTVARGLRKPGAVRIDAKGRLFALDDGTGVVYRVGRADGQLDVVARLPLATDNMIVSPTGHLLVSNMADNSVWDVDPDTGAKALLIGGQLAFPRALIAVDEPQGTTLYVADTHSIRTVDGRTGQVKDLVRRVAADLRVPSSISLARDRLVVSGEILGAVQTIDRATGRIVATLVGFDHPSDAVALVDGSIVVAEPVGGRLVIAYGAMRDVMVSGLDRPVSLADAHDGTLLVGSASGTLFRVDVKTRVVSRLASGLGALRTVVPTPDHGAIALDVAGKRLLRIAADGTSRVLATGLPVGYLTAPYPRSGGVTVDGRGVIYVAADTENAIYRLDVSAAISAH